MKALFIAITEIVLATVGFVLSILLIPFAIIGLVLRKLFKSAPSAAKKTAPDDEEQKSEQAADGDPNRVISQIQNEYLPKAEPPATKSSGSVAQNKPSTKAADVKNFGALHALLAMVGLFVIGFVITYGLMSNSFNKSASAPSGNKRGAAVGSKEPLPSKYLATMIDGAKSGNEAAIVAAVEAIKQLPQPVRGNRKSARAANDAGLAAIKLNAFDEALLRFNEALRADPSDQEIHNNRGYALMMVGNLPEARSSFEASLALAPTRTSAWANLAVALVKEGRTDEGRAAYLLAFRFSQNQNKTREFLSKQSQTDPDEKVRELATDTLNAITAHFAERDR
jgi:tetratricopeptide (TPR) repeat protein